METAFLSKQNYTQRFQDIGGEMFINSLVKGLSHVSPKITKVTVHVMYHTVPAPHWEGDRIKH